MSEFSLANFQYTPYTGPLIAIGIALVLLGFYLWTRPAPHAKTAMMLVWGCAVWILGYTGEIASYDIQSKIFWGKIQYIGITPIPVLWHISICQFTGRSR